MRLCILLCISLLCCLALTSTATAFAMPREKPITNSHYEITGIAVKGIEPIQWSDNYGNNESYIYKLLEIELCTIVGSSLEELNMKYDHCQLTILEKATQDQVALKLKVFFKGYIQINVELWQEKIKYFSMKNSQMTGIGGEIQIREHETIIVSAIEITGIAVKGETQLPWDDKYKNTSSSIFEVMEKELCSVVSMALEEVTVSYDECKLLTLQKTPAEQVSVKLAVKFKKDIEIDLQQLKDNLQMISVKHSDLTGIGDEIEITAIEIKTTTMPTTTTTPIVTTTEGTIITSSIEITGIAVKGETQLPWDDKYKNTSSNIFEIMEKELCSVVSMALKEITLSYSKCELLTLQKSTEEKVSFKLSVIFQEDFEIDLLQLKENLQNISAKNPDLTGIGGEMEIIAIELKTTSEQPIFAAAFQAKGIVISYKYPVSWDDAYLEKESELFAELQKKLCKAMRNICRRMKFEYGSCELLSAKEGSESRVFAHVEVVLQKEYELDIPLIKKEMVGYAEYYDVETIIAEEIEIIPLDENGNPQ